MDMVKEAQRIYHSDLSKEEKIAGLKDLMLDCYNEMEAQDQNMHPEVKHNNAEGYLYAKNKVRDLESS